MLLIFSVNTLAHSFERQKGYYNYKCLSKIFKRIQSKTKHGKIWRDKGSKFYNISMTSWLRKNAIETYSTRNEEKPVVAEKFIETLNNKLYKFVTLIQKMSILKSR